MSASVICTDYMYMRIVGTYSVACNSDSEILAALQTVRTVVRFDLARGLSRFGSIWRCPRWFEYQ